MDGDFDVNQRSADGCIPPLLAMARPGGSDAERDVALMEQEVQNAPDLAARLLHNGRGVRPCPMCREEGLVNIQV